MTAPATAAPAVERAAPERIAGGAQGDVAPPAAVVVAIEVAADIGGVQECCY